MIKQYQPTNNIKSSTPGTPMMFDEDFFSLLDKVNEIVKQMGFIILITSSFRKTTIVPGAIVQPAKMGNHLIGHAFDCNLQEIKTGEYYNSVKMGDGRGDDECVIQAIKKILFWGGEFRDKDEVHFDDRLNINNPELYKTKFKEFHS